MSLGIVNPNYKTNYNYCTGKTGEMTKTRGEMISDFYSGISSAAEKSTTKGVGEPIGLTMMKFGNTNQHYGMVATYSDASTDDNPIIRVTSNYGGENVTYDVRINEVNPHKASQLEMFALSSYMDDQGLSDGGSFGTYSKMKYFGMNAENSGYVEGFTDSNNFMSQKFDWIDIMLSIMRDYLGNPATYSQGLDCQKMITGFENWYSRFNF